MIRRLTAVLALLLAVVPTISGQARKIFSLPDRMMSSSRIGKVSTISGPSVPLPDTSRISFPEGGSRFISEDIGFYEYLSGEGLDTDAVTLLRGRYVPSDTLDFLRGRELFSTRRWTQASELLARIPSSSAYWTESFFLDINSLVFLGQYDSAASKLATGEQAFSHSGGPYNELYAQQGAGLALLRNDKGNWLRYSGAFTYSDYTLEESERIMSEIAGSRFSGKRRHAGVAALLSGIVPGAGKVYAGRTGEGVASFLTVGSLAAITAENWNKHGLKDWRTIVAGGLCATFYLGNIYGSYISVSIEKDERTKAEDSLIIYHLHIPVRSNFR